MTARILIRFDDVAANMAWDTFERVVRTCEEFGIKPLIGVIPDNRDPELLAYPSRADFWNVVRGLQADGWSIAQR